MNRAERLAADGVPADVEPVLFYRPSDPFGYFSNLSPRGVRLPSIWVPGELDFYASGEAAFQARKMRTREHHDAIRAPAPRRTSGRGAIRRGSGRGPDSAAPRVLDLTMG